MYKTEPHIHVSEVSACSELNAKEMMKLYYEAGYKTVFITDHFYSLYFDTLGDIPWEDKVTIFFSGFYKAKVAGKKYGVNVLPGAEILFDEDMKNGSYNHYLLYGGTKEFYASHPELCQMTAEEFYKLAKENGIFVIQAHPNREEINHPTTHCVDAMEIYNSSPKHRDFSERSEKVALENNLYTTVGSDAHRAEDIGRCAIYTEREIKTVEEYIEYVKNGNFKVFKELKK